jgi:ABC-type Fe3+-hydroxamate transport system substrate-binding protein
MKQHERIISVVPSQTELLYHLGLDKEVVGITKFCVHPEEWFRTKTRVGGTKTLDIERIKSLHPDLIIANKEENTKEQIEDLQTFCQVYVSDIRSVSDALQMIQTVGNLTRKSKEAGVLVDAIRVRFETLNKKIGQPQRVAYLIWKDPYMAVGNDTFIHDMLERVGWQNVFEDLERYPETTVEELCNRQPELVLLSSEPYPFAEKHLEALQHVLPKAQILLVDGTQFSWYGSRMLQASDYINEIFERIQ